MNCSEVDDVLGAYALGAMSEADAQLVRDHMLTCRRHDADLEELRGAARRIAASVEPVPPSPGLRSRVLAAIDAERESDRKTRDRDIRAAPRPIWTSPGWT